MDKFKNFLQQHKEALNLSDPDQHTWDNIISQVKHTPDRRRWHIIRNWSVAAAVLILAGITALYLHRGKAPQQAIAENTVARDAAPDTIAIIPHVSTAPSPVLPDMTGKQETKLPATQQPNAPVKPGNTASLSLVALENSYTEILNRKLTTLRTLPLYAGTEDCVEDFKKQLKQINKDQHDLEEKIKKEGLNDELLQHLIVIYQQKLSLLEQLQMQINKMNNLNGQLPAKNDSSGIKHMSSLI